LKIISTGWASDQPAAPGSVIVWKNALYKEDKS